MSIYRYIQLEEWVKIENESYEIINDQYSQLILRVKVSFFSTILSNYYCMLCRPLHDRLVSSLIKLKTDPSHIVE